MSEPNEEALGAYKGLANLTESEILKIFGAVDLRADSANVLPRLIPDIPELRFYVVPRRHRRTTHGE